MPTQQRDEGPVASHLRDQMAQHRTSQKHAGSLRHTAWPGVTNQGRWQPRPCPTVPEMGGGEQPPHCSKRAHRDAASGHLCKRAQAGMDERPCPAAAAGRADRGPSLIVLGVPPPQQGDVWAP